MTEETQKPQPRLTTDDPNHNHQLKPIFIDEDRYSGAYSGHCFTAWFGAVPDDIDAGDTGCQTFWRNNDIVFGGGDTSDKAVADLLDVAYFTSIIKTAVSAVCARKGWSGDAFEQGVNMTLNGIQEVRTNLAFQEAQPDMAS